MIRVCRIILTLSLAIIVFFSSGCGSNIVSGTVIYQPPFIPLNFSIDTNGVISIHGGVSIPSPVGTFSASADVYSKLNPEDNTLFLVIRHLENGSVVDTEYKIKIGQDEVTVITNGSSKIDVTQHKVLIDASKGSIQTIEVKGNNASTATPTTSPASLTWTANQVIGDTVSDQPPALAVFHDTLYMAYIDTKNGNGLRLVSSTDGANWTDNHTIGTQASPRAPTLAVWNDTLIMAFVANNDNRSLLLVSSQG